MNLLRGYLRSAACLGHTNQLNNVIARFATSHYGIRFIERSVDELEWHITQVVVGCSIIIATSGMLTMRKLLVPDLLYLDSSHIALLLCLSLFVSMKEIQSNQTGCACDLFFGHCR